jgi:hypothetical protein
MAAKIFLIMVALLGVMGSLGGCVIVPDSGPVVVAKEPGPPPWAPAHGHRAKHRYYYYPESAVYFDASSRVYFYSTGGTWRTSAALPSGIYVDTGRYTVLEMDSDRPYAYHGDVERRYPPGQMKKDHDQGKGKKKWW